MTRATHPGSFHLFRAFGVDVFVHWSWLVVAVLVIQVRDRLYDHVFYAIASYLALFGIVVLHEFGHALACKSVGGRAERIVLWPLGGVALVQPPDRPLPVLWSIAAGPLVNVALVPVLGLAAWLAVGETPMRGWSDPQTFVFYLAATNLVLLAFNILPIYPLDGGQILQAVLWLFMRRSLALRIAAGAGLALVVAAAPLLIWMGDIWLGVMALFLGWQAWQGLQMARALAHYEAQAAREAEDAPWRM